MDTQTQKNIFLESDDHADYKNIFCFEIGAKLKNLLKYANFAYFGPPFRTSNEFRFPKKLYRKDSY